MNQTVLPVAITSSLVNAYQDGTGKKMSAQDIIGYCARISNPDNQNNAENGKLLKYLIDNKHWSPFEMVDMVLEINTTRDIARQILRHSRFHSKSFHNGMLIRLKTLQSICVKHGCRILRTVKTL